jgi:uncharacterized protein YbjT (DUF2867 family)
MKNKKVLIIGATGLVGGHIIQQLLQSDEYSEVIILARKKIDHDHPKLKQIVFDFENIESTKIIADDLYCAMGTTLSKAGSKDAQYHIDLEIPFNIAKIAQSNGIKGFYLVSSLGADATSGNFYLKTKGELEQKIKALNFETFVSFRPSMLLGDRQESRLGESIGKVLVKIIEPILFGNLKKYAGIEASTVAKAMLNIANSGKKGTLFIESDTIKSLAKEA